ncbi:TOBE domain-containing protein [Sulfurimonas sp.]|jgi:molybdopterin-binding protein|uniref:TOBE domain-containing protein n=1 Tax=Sulfurimonas sp. TaxID=2022749 RepID=UPI0025E26FC9|nr:TOBE domain-containing protein [Sulfurimonas sp.]MCK9473388.1 TOBE domain-containing protein [Sulfurimonas sp.]MDD3506635.1 TOBE domain-containing protein [Sulfurimonas sp.]
MSELTAIVNDIQKHDSLHIVKFDCEGQALTMMSLELDKTIQKGVKVKLSMKPTHVAIAKNLQGELSYSNQLQATITGVLNGELLSSISLKLHSGSAIESIITKNSSIRMNLQVGDSVVALIKASEVSIKEVISC